MRDGAPTQYFCGVIPDILNPSIIIIIFIITVVVVNLITRIARINYTILLGIFIPHYLCIRNDPLAIPHDLFATCHCHLVAIRPI